MKKRILAIILISIPFDILYIVVGLERGFFIPTVIACFLAIMFGCVAVGINLLY